jgi:hypothetical protein
MGKIVFSEEGFIEPKYNILPLFSSLVSVHVGTLNPWSTTQSSSVYTS